MRQTSHRGLLPWQAQCLGAGRAPCTAFEEDNRPAPLVNRVRSSGPRFPSLTPSFWSRQLYEHFATKTLTTGAKRLHRQAYHLIDGRVLRADEAPFMSGRRNHPAGEIQVGKRQQREHLRAILGEAEIRWLV